MSSQHARRIAPAPSRDSSSGSGQATPSTGHGLRALSAKRASTACQNCKHIKRKCDQDIPCANCVRTGAECVYDAAADGRRRAARKRTVEELESKGNALDSILDIFRTAGPSQVQELVNLIRADASLDEILQLATGTEEKILSQQPAALSVTEDATVPRRAVFTVTELAETPLFQIPASPWTTVTTDDGFVSHLFSLYFTWCHPTYPVLGQAPFLRALISGDVESKYCAPILVNAALAMGCQFSDRSEAYRDASNPASRGTHFLEQSTRLWLEEIENPRLVTIQTGLIISLVTAVTGKDRMSYLFLDQLRNVIDEVNFRHQNITEGDQEDVEYDSCLTMANWMWFDLMVGYSLSFLKSVSLTPPDRQYRSAMDEIFSTTKSWIPYPHSKPEYELHLGQLSMWTCELHRIGFHVARFMFDDWRLPGTSQRATLRYLEGQLVDILHRLPPLTQNDAFDPHIMNLQLIYHFIRMTLYGFLKRSGSAQSSPEESQQVIERGLRECLASSRLVSDMYRRYFQEIGSRSLTMWMPQTALTAAHIMIDHLEEPGVSECFHNACCVIIAASRRWFTMRGHARMIFITVEQKGQVFPERTRYILEQVALHSWGQEEHKLFTASTYPNYSLAKVRDPRTTGMGDLLEQWSAFNVNDDSMDQTVLNTENE